MVCEKVLEFNSCHFIRKVPVPRTDRHTKLSAFVPRAVVNVVSVWLLRMEGKDKAGSSERARRLWLAAPPPRPARVPAHNPRAAGRPAERRCCRGESSARRAATALPERVRSTYGFNRLVGRAFHSFSPLQKYLVNNT